ADRCQVLIHERQHAIDHDDDERAIITDTCRANIRLYGHDPDQCFVFIPSRMIADWLQDATGIRRETNKASAYLANLSVPELLPEKKGGERGWSWCGRRWDRRRYPGAQDVGFPPPSLEAD